MKKLLIFACRRGRTRDLPLLRAGAQVAGLRFVQVLFPLAWPVLLLAAVARSLGVAVSVVISDRFAGDSWLARLFGPDAVRMLWNYADEFPRTLHAPPDKRVCFFEDAAHPVQLFRFAPQLRLRSTNSGPRRQVLFIGDVTNSTSLEAGAAWWEERFAALHARHGHGFYLTPEYRDLLASHAASPAERRLAHVLCKNLLRLWIVQSVSRAFGDRLQLVGPNWGRFGLASQPAAYSLQARLDLYESATVNLDCGSKSGDAALYPRSSEIISYAGAPVQVVCADSSMVFGARAGEFVYADEHTLHTLLEHRLAEPEAQRLERAEWLAQHLERQQLTMADSFRHLWAPSTSRPVPAPDAPTHRR